MRSLLLILFSVLLAQSFAQTGNYQYLDVQRRFSLAARTVKGISNDTTWLIGSADSLVTQYAVKGYLYNRIGNGNIFGEEHQQVVIKQDNTNTYEAIEPLIEGNFVVNDTELTAAKLTFVDQATIFNTWKRGSYGDNSGGTGSPHPSNVIPGTPSETQSWNYNSSTQTINSTVNSSSYLVFTSTDKYSSYTHSLNIAASGADNDYVTTVMAYVEDPNDLVPNNAFGLTPSSYPGVNTTDAFIPNQHTLSLVRGRTAQDSFPFVGQTIRYAIVYDLGKLTEQVLVNGENLVWNTNADYGTGANCDIEVIRAGDILKGLTTEWSDAPGGKGPLGHPLIYDLSTNALTQKFRGSAAYGYGAMSQQDATFSNITISPNKNTIYDLRNGQKWVADAAGNYSLDTSNFYKDFGIRRWVYNPTTAKTFYVKADRNYDLIGGGGGIIGDTSTLYHYTFNNLDFENINNNISIIPKPELEPGFNAWLSNYNPILSDSTYLDGRDFSDTGTISDPIRTKPFIITTSGTSGPASYNHDTKVLNIPQYSGGGTSYTDAQARAAITLTTTGTSGAASYNSSTGVLNVPQYSSTSGTVGWLLAGNLINPATDFIGTTSNNSFRVRTNNIERAVFDSAGNINFKGKVNVTNTSFIGTGMTIQHTANNTDVIMGGPGTENITFGPSNRIFLNAGQVSFPNGVLTSSGNTFNLLGANIGASTGSVVLVGNGNNIVTSTGSVGTGLEIKPTMQLQNQGTGNSLLIDPQINNTSTSSGLATAVIHRGIYYNPNMINMVGTTKHIAIETATGLIILRNLPTFSDNASAVSALGTDVIYRDGDLLKITH